MRKRSGALIIKNQKLLLIDEGYQGLYWTPGGGLEGNETYENALKRELIEELDVQIKSLRLFVDIEDVATKEPIKYYLVWLKNDPKETYTSTKLYWYSKKDFQEKKVKISPRFSDIVFPKLMAENLV